jgi:transposase
MNEEEETPMSRKLKETLIEQPRSLVLQQGLKGRALAQALGVDERTAREYAKHVREEAEGASANGQGQAQTPPAATRIDVFLNQIHRGDATQARVSLDHEVLAQYVEDLSEGAKFPPVTLFHDGTQFWIGDGYHRVEAARRVGFQTIRAEVREGGQREALLFACSANAEHGLRRTNADKRRAVILLLGDEECARWSDHKIARHCRVTHPFVGNVRRSLETVSSDDGQRTYLREGRKQTMNVTRIGGRMATTAPAKGEPRDDLETHPAPVMEPEADEDDATWEAEEDDNILDEEDGYTLYCNAWQMLSQARAMWERNVHSGDGERDRQFPVEVVKRAGEEIGIHIEALQETAQSLQDFAAALQRARQQA